MVLNRRTLAIICVAVIATLAVVTIALTVFPQNSGLSAGLCPNPPDNCLFQIVGTIAITSQSGAGVLNLSIENVANYPFTNIGVAGITPSLGGLVSDAPFTNNGTAISASNPLQIASYSSGSYRFSSGGSNGTTYTITVTATMTNGQIITEKTRVVAEG